MFSEVYDIQKIMNAFDESLPVNPLTELMTKYYSDKGLGLSPEVKKYKNTGEFNCSAGGVGRNGVYHTYTYLYYELFKDLDKSKEFNFFEMGVGVPSIMGSLSFGGSLKGWQDFFPKANIYSAEYIANEETGEGLINENRIKSFWCDARDEQIVSEMFQNKMNGLMFDIIIDDSLHEEESNFSCYKGSISKLLDKGIYVIEDVDLDYIDRLCDRINNYNKENNINCVISKAIVPWGSADIIGNNPNWGHHKQNNLIIIQKK